MRTFDCHEIELMDGPQPPSRQLTRTLRELESLNRRFGGHRYALRFMARHFRPGSTYRILDLATGGGDFPRAMVDWARERGIALEIDAVDASPAIAELAESFSADYPEITYFLGDAVSFDSGMRYDLVHCSLALHHFSTAQAVELLKRCRSLSKNLVLVTDLERRLMTSLGVGLANRFFGHSPMTCRDGATSARRAFSFREFRLLAKGAGWAQFGHQRFLFCRQALWLQK